MLTIDDVRVTPQDMLSVAFCARGSKQFARDHGLDFKEFVTHGIPAVQLIALNDAMATKAVKAACIRMGVEWNG